MFRSLVKGVYDLVYPPHCFLCKDFQPQFSSHDILCPQCFEKIIWNTPPFCLKCSRHLNSYYSESWCLTCQKFNPHFDFAWSATLYEEPIRGLIHAFKFEQKTQLRFLFKELIVSFIKNYNLDIEQFDFFVPIPLSSTRLRERSYNQSLLLAQLLAEHFERPMLTHHLIRHKHTRQQTELGQKERWTNIHGAFRIKNSNDLTNKNILIIDDLLTTGATASEAAKSLKSAGAKKVGVLTLAIA